MNNDWYIYMLRYQGGKLYTGITTDVERRFAEHSSGGSRSARALRGKGPFELVYCEQVATRSEALVREAQIKKMSKPEKQSLLHG